MATATDYETIVKSFQWEDLRALWDNIEPLQNNPAIRELINVLESIQKTADKSNLLIKL